MMYIPPYVQEKEKLFFKGALTQSNKFIEVDQDTKNHTADKKPPINTPISERSGIGNKPMGVNQEIFSQRQGLDDKSVTL